jgi:hypothetical protein
MDTRVTFTSPSAALADRRPTTDLLSHAAGARGSLPTLRQGVPPRPWGTGLASLAAAGTVVLLLLTLSWITHPSKPASARIDPGAYALVSEGMRREEVQAAIGLAPGDYRDGAHRPGGRSHTDWSEEAATEEFGARDTAVRLQWEGNAYSIVAGFDESGVVTWKTLWKHEAPTAHGPYEQLRAWLDR